MIKIARCFTVFSIIIVQLSLTCSFAFKDVNTEVNTAVEGFNQEGLFGFFIHRFGQDLFRPDGTVSRADLILVLNEYHILTKKLIAQDREIMRQLDTMKSGDSSANMDNILREFQKVLDPMLKNSMTIKTLSQKVAAAEARTVPAQAAAAAGPDKTYVDAEINKLKTEIADLSSRLEKLSQEAASAPSPETGAMSKDDNKKIGVLKAEVNGLKEDIIKLRTVVNKHQKDIYDIVKEEKVSSPPAKGQDISGGDLARLDQKIDELDKKIQAVDRKSSDKQHSALTMLASDAGGFPVWARLSMGFSTLILLFMAR
ncbi:MAG: hypothetical protein JXJ19_08505 [Elusimicrobia bacterium]|nr:hypothetical protein [Elusimicrobiota bacterium]